MKRSKNYRKEKLKKLVRMVALVYTFDPKIWPEGTERGAGDLIVSAVQWKEKSP